MRLLAFLLTGAALSASPAWAETASGSSALALAGLVGLHAPNLSAGAKRVLSLMLDGRLSFSFPSGEKILVRADAVTCRSSNVDIAAHDCTLQFGSEPRRLHGRAAHELYATLSENGASSDGAAGSSFETLSKLACTITPSEVKERGGGGADCAFEPAP